MTLPDTAAERRALADRLQTSGDLTSPDWRAAVEAVPRELFLLPGVFLPTEGGRWRPVTALGADPGEWVEIAYSDQTLVTQLDGHLTPDRTAEPVEGLPTSTATVPATVVSKIEALELENGQCVLEIGTGTGYSTALMCHRLGADNVTSIEVDPDIAARADAALEAAGFSTRTVTRDGLLGHPGRAPYDKVIATCTVRRIPYTWVRQTKPGGTILATVGSWSHGTGLAKVTVNEDGTAEGRIIGRLSFLPARLQAMHPFAGDLLARAAYADTERHTPIAPQLLNEWMPAFLAQLAAPGAQLVRVIPDGFDQTVYLFDPERESFAQLGDNGEGWTVRQGGPIALWDAVESALTAWQEAGRPDISAVRLQITDRSHTYWIGGQQSATEARSPWMGDTSPLRWEHRVA